MITLIDRGVGDAAIGLSLREERDCIFGAVGRDLTLALETNAGPIAVELSDLGPALDALHMSASKLKALVISAYPTADGWDWS